MLLLWTLPCLSGQDLWDRNYYGHARHLAWWGQWPLLAGNALRRRISNERKRQKTPIICWTIQKDHACSQVMQLTAVLAEQTFILPYLIISVFILSGVDSKYERHLSEALGRGVMSHVWLGKIPVSKTRQEALKHLLTITSAMVITDSMMSKRAIEITQAEVNHRRVKRRWLCGRYLPSCSCFPLPSITGKFILVLYQVLGNTSGHWNIRVCTAEMLEEPLPQLWSGTN